MDALQLGNRELLLHDGEALVGVDEFVKDLQSRKPWLFDAGKPSSVNPTLPSPARVGPAGKPDYSKLSTEELRQRLRDLGR
jgi:hypothetical protein